MNKQDLISLELHTVVNDKLLLNPDLVINKAKDNLNRWEKSLGYVHSSMTEWQKILTQDVTTISNALIGTDQNSILLRSSSPFSSVLTEQERMNVFNKFKSK